MDAILITGVGGGVGQSIIKCLRGTNHRLIGVDAQVLGTGLYAVDRGYTIPYAVEPEYVQRLLEIAKAERCTLLFPGIDAELPRLAQSVEQFVKIGVRPVVSCPEVVGIGDDKLVTTQFLSARGFPSPRTCLLSDSVACAELPFPVVLKPRKGGARSRGVYVVHSSAELEAHRSLHIDESYVAQEHIQGDEFTCGTITLEGHCFGAIIMRRVLRDGDTYKAFVVKDPKLTEFVMAVAETLKPFGPCNFQLRVRDDIPYIFEFNTRCSGTSYCRALAGFNEPLMVADFLLRRVAPRHDIREISVLRYWKELVVDNRRIEQLTAGGVIAGDGSRL